MNNISNDTSNLYLNIDWPDLHLKNEAFDYSFYIIVYVLIFGICSFTGTLGNLLVIITLIFEKSLRKSQNLFIGSLASADLVVSCLTMPASMTGVLLGSSWFEEHHNACIFVSSFCSTSCTASLFGISWIAVSRYFYIARTDIYQKYFTTFRIIIYIILIWIMAIIVHLPNHVGWGSIHFSKILFVCTVDTETFSYKIFYACISLTSIVISFVFYGRIYLILRGTTLAKSMVIKQSLKRAGNGRQSCLEEEIKMIRATFKIFVSFFVCWSPVTVLLFADLGDAVPLWAYLYSGLLAHANSTLNFFVYYLQNDNFTNSLKRFLNASSRTWTMSLKNLTT